MEVNETLKDVTISNLIILLFILSCGLFVREEYVLVAILGLLIGLMNLYLRAIMLNRLVVRSSSIKSALHMRGYVIRVALTAFIGAYLYTLDNYYVIAYMTGYVLHFSGVILHGYKLKLMEWK